MGPGEEDQDVDRHARSTWQSEINGTLNPPTLSINTAPSPPGSGTPSGPCPCPSGANKGARFLSAGVREPFLRRPPPPLATGTWIGAPRYRHGPQSGSPPLTSSCPLQGRLLGFHRRWESGSAHESRAGDWRTRTS